MFCKLLLVSFFVEPHYTHHFSLVKSRLYHGFPEFIDKIHKNSSNFFLFLFQILFEFTFPLFFFFSFFLSNLWNRSHIFAFFTKFVNVQNQEKSYKTDVKLNSYSLRSKLCHEISELQRKKSHLETSVRSALNPNRTMESLP